VNDTVTFRRLSSLSDGSPSRATSQEAIRISERLKEFSESFRQAETLHGHAIRELQDAFLDGRECNWDGYSALPVSDSAFLKASCFLDRTLNLFPPPTASATPSGSLSLEWFVSPERRLMVSIGDDELLAFAALLGSDSVHGTVSFVSDLPPEVGQHLKRLFYW
jgi:hypothetical protein